MQGHRKIQSWRLLLSDSLMDLNVVKMVYYKEVQKEVIVYQKNLEF